MRKIVTSLAVLACSAAFVGCSSGVNPSTITYGAKQYRAIGPQQTYGIRPEAKRALTIPPRALTCLTTGAAKGLVVLGETGECLWDVFLPPEVVPVQAFEQYAPDNLGACAPEPRSACPSGACAPPPVAAPAAPRGACLPPARP